ncbi:AAA family ATPase, partial [Colletotrichum kahawae]
GPAPYTDDFHLFCFHWRFNGTRFTPQQKLVVIKPFEGEKDVTELAFFPKQFCKSDNPILQSLIDKGEKFKKLRYGHGVYKGLNVQPQPPRFVDEEVFIDFSSGFEAKVESIENYVDERPLSLPFTDKEELFGRRCDRQPHCWTCDINISVSKLEMKRASDFRVTGKYALTVSPEGFPTLSEDTLVMLPSTLIGYGLKSKDWYLLDMYKLKMAETTGPERQQSFDHLVIPSKTKRLLQALVKNHGITTESPGGNEDDFKNEIDIVKGKGNGVVIFLYGPPGVGKTSTAETIAAYSNPARPLYAIVSGS